jgi:hypothetical protein
MLNKKLSDPGRIAHASSRLLKGGGGIFISQNLESPSKIPQLGNYQHKTPPFAR